MIFCGCNIPDGVREAIDRYVENRVETGSFTRSVLENDLNGAIGRADPQSLAALKDIVSHVYNCIPRACQGSPETVEGWLAGVLSP